MITLDSRVGSKEFYASIHRCNVPVQMGRLEFADAAFVGNGEEGPVGVGIEIKRIGDLLDSIFTGRFAAYQLPGLLNSYHVVWLLIVGAWRPGPRGQLEIERQPGHYETPPWMNRELQAEWLEAWITTMEIQGGINVTTRPDFRGSVGSFIASRYRWFARDYHSHQGLKAVKVSKPPTRTTRLANMLPIAGQKMRLHDQSVASWPGVGWELAPRVIKHFETYEQAVTAPPERWMEIRGIGKEKAKMLWTFFHEEWKG